MGGRWAIGVVAGVGALLAGAAPALAGVSLKTEPTSTPAFSRAVSDYVVPCADGGVDVSLRARGKTRVSVDEGPFRRGRVEQRVPLEPGQRFELLVRGRSSERSHHVRCLPDSYPGYGFTQRREAAADQYVFAPTIGNPRPRPSHVSIFDEHGAPIWWLPVKRSLTVDARVLSDGSVAYGHVPFRSAFDGYEVRSLDGKSKRVLQAEGGPTDTHELVELEGGRYLMLANKLRTGVDLRPYGGPENAAIYESEIQEFNRKGRLTWTWNSSDHIALEETREWWDFVFAFPTQVEGVGKVYNPTHMNSIEPVGERGALVFSLRHTNAVYKIARSGRVVWKLGGTKTPERLRLRGDELAPQTFGGQHDAQLLGKNGLTVFDNGTLRNRPPRALRFELEPKAGKARLVESRTDPEAGFSACCGSVRVIDGSWLVNWGAVSEFAAEYDARGRTAWRLRTPDLTSYRVVPVAEGLISDAELRAGMDAMNPRRPSPCTSDEELIPGRAATPGDDRLRGRRVAEYVRGLGGADAIDGRAGDDCVLGDDGPDRLEGGAGDDQLIGGAGSDRVEGGRGRDEISCGAGEDVAVAKGGDTIAANCERIVRANKPAKGEGKGKGSAR